MNTIRNKKGFTIIELVVVIAVIAILAAVLIPTFASLVQKANVSVDIQLIRNLNAVLATDAASNGKHPTLFDANETLKESGYDITKIKLSTEGAQLLWDSKNDVFCYYAGDGNAPEYVPEIDNAEKPDFENAKHTYFAIYEHMPETQTFSIYYNGTEAINANVKVGFDAGVSAASVTVETDEAISVIIRTSYTKAEDGSFAMGNLTVKAPKGDIKHYGTVNELKVISTDPENCYHEYGYVGKLVKDSFLPATEESGTDVGKFIAENVKFHQTETEIKTITEYKHFEVVNAAYGQHFFGTDGNENKCTVAGCEEVNPEHECIPGAPYTENGHYIVKCTVCGKTLADVEITGGTGTDCTEHNYETSTTSATCTTPGITLKVCKNCGHVEMQTIPALGHDMQTQTQAQAATCTAAGETESKKCSRCDHTTGGDNIPALGHDYSRTTHKCTRCDADEPTTAIDSDIINEIKQEANGVFSIGERTNLTANITFGYKQDYINNINGIKFESNNSDVEIIGVFRKNPNHGKQFTLPDGTSINDSREYVIDLYVLSEKLMQYIPENLKTAGGLLTLYGTGVCTDTTAAYDGAIDWVKFENFDTSKTDNFAGMFYLSLIKNVDLSSFIIKDNAEFVYNNVYMFDQSVISKIILPEGWELETNGNKSKLVKTN